MSFIEKSLLNNETVLHKGKLHWMSYTKAALVMLLALMLLMGGSIEAFVLFGLLACVIGFVNYMNVIGSEFAITNKRLVIKSGVIRRKSFDTQLSKVEGVGVEQGLFGRIFGYGNLVVTGTGSSRSIFGMLTNPAEFKQQLQQSIENSASAAKA